jgi:hypothetical protein
MAPRRLGSAIQYQDITRALKGITDFYPPESCLRELLQNADDAGATEIVGRPSFLLCNNIDSI